MKTTKLVVTVALSLFSFTAIMAQSHDHSKMDHSKTEKQEKVTYVCPMHPEVTSNKLDDCTKCGMKMVKQEKKSKTAYACPMKCEGDKTYAKAGDCPKCGMNLKETKAVKKKEDAHKGHHH